MRYVILIFFLFWIFFTSAQLNETYTFRHIDQSGGLLYPTVTGIGQDARGFIWILTSNGLQRYDGSRFLNYPEVVRQSSFGIMQSSQLYVDTLKDQIWVIKGDQMEVLNLSDNKVNNLDLKGVLTTDTIHPAKLFMYDNGNQQLIGENGSILYEKNTVKILGSFFNLNPASDHQNTYILKDPSTGNFWLHDFFDLIIADVYTNQIYSSSDIHPEHPLLIELKKRYGNNNRIRYIMIDSDHNLWISTWTTLLFRYNFDKKVLFTYSLKDILQKENSRENSNVPVQINVMYEDRQKNIWMATDYAGLLRYDKEKDDFYSITSDEKISNGLRYSFSITSIFQDRDDNIWLGTDRGISIFNPYRNYFQSIRHADGNEASIPKYDINDVIETKEGEILIGTWGGGISVYDRDWTFIRNVTFPNISQNLIWSFIQNDDGTIWAGTQDGYIHIYDSGKHIFKTIHPEETGYSTILKMERDNEGNILMGLQNGKVSVWNERQQKFYSYVDSLTTVSLSYTGVVDMYVDDSNRCWVGTGSGLQEFDIRKRAYINLYRPDSTEAVSGVSIEGIEKYNDSLLLVGTIYKGIYFFNINSKKFSRVTSDNHLNHTSVYAIQKDHKDNIWFTTNYSIYKMNADHVQPVVYNMDHAMMNAAFTSSGFKTLMDGRWITNTPAEIICFNPEKIESEQNDHFKVEISGFSVYNKDIYIDSFLRKHVPVILAFNQNFFSIGFTVLNFMDLRTTNYYYRLTSVDNDWIQSDTKPFANYTDIKPGEYVFEVKAEQGNGFSKITSFPIIITPPWWGTWWIRLLSFFAIGTAIYMVVKKRIQNIRKHSELRHRVSQTEMMALRAQMNPHFIFNCLNSIDNLIQTDQKTKATDYLAKFAQLIRAILENSKANSIPCWKDLDALKLYLEMESLRWDNKINYLINIDPQIQNGDYKVPPMTIQPFVENAIHHGLLNKIGRDKKLDIEVKLEDHFIKYTITDNGVGRLKAGEYKKLNHISRKSLGLQITSERIHLFNKNENNTIKISDLYDIQGNPDGTKVEVWLTTHPTT
ncbi:MAG: two-component regulator propeller domain-containing protein [Saprospiraceae bacterium]